MSKCWSLQNQKSQRKTGHMKLFYRFKKSAVWVSLLRKINPRIHIEVINFSVQCWVISYISDAIDFIPPEQENIRSFKHIGLSEYKLQWVHCQPNHYKLLLLITLSHLCKLYQIQTHSENHQNQRSPIQYRLILVLWCNAVRFFISSSHTIKEGS